jgi:hypothetical protein
LEIQRICPVSRFIMLQDCRDGKIQIAALEEAGEDFTESLWGSMVEKMTVFEDGLVFTLTSGEEVKV